MLLLLRVKTYLGEKIITRLKPLVGTVYLLTFFTNGKATTDESSVKGKKKNYTEF